MTFEKFTDETWDAIRATRDGCPDEIDWPKARDLIEEVGRECSAVEDQREERRRSVAYKEDLDRARRNLIGLQAMLLRLEAQSPSGDDLVGLPDPGLKRYEARLDELATQYETWCTPFGGRKNRNRETLNNRLLAIWEEQLHGRLRSSKSSSRNKAEEPIGPLVRYLRLTLKAILGESPGPHGIKDIIDKAKNRRRSNPGKRKPVGRKLRQGQEN
jgi:hypothetical protein